MYFAVSYGDLETFQKIHNWLHSNMELNKYNLYAWKWGKRDSGSWGILDYNNATDGDMWIAYSLLLAYEKWGNHEYLKEAEKLISEIKKSCLIRENGKLLLIPASFGFVQNEYIQLNPSYTIPFIFDKFAIYDKDRIWQSLVLDSLSMFEGSALGNLKMHPDWIMLDRKSRKYDYLEEKSIFGFDSIRTPLFLARQYQLKREMAFKELLVGYRVFMQYIKKLDKYIYQIDFKSHRIRYRYPPYGFIAVYRYLFKIFNLEPLEEMDRKIEKGIKNETDNYYSFSLLLFTDIFSE
jgi:endoglucanase